MIPKFLESPEEQLGLARLPLGLHPEGNTLENPSLHSQQYSFCLISSEEKALLVLTLQLSKKGLL